MYIKNQVWPHHVKQNLKKSWPFWMPVLLKTSETMFESGAFIIASILLAVKVLYEFNTNALTWFLFVKYIFHILWLNLFGIVIYVHVYLLDVLLHVFHLLNNKWIYLRFAFCFLLYMQNVFLILNIKILYTYPESVLWQSKII